MTHNYLASVTLLSNTGLPKDSFVNTFHFIGPDAPSGADLAALSGAVAAFYGTDTEQVSHSEPVGERAVIDYLGRQIAAGNVHPFKIYDLEEPIPRVPVYTNTFNLTPPAFGKIPAEVAVCLSYHADIVSGDVAARKRGRIYLGPINDHALNTAANDPTVSDNFQQVLRKSAERLAGDLAFAGVWFWSVFSQAGGGVAAPIIGGWIDNACDTQRRRGQAATARLLWGL